MDNCADCGKPIDMHEPSYYRKDPTEDIGKSYHSHCGDPFGIKAKDAKIERLQALVNDCPVCSELDRYARAAKRSGTEQ